LPFNVASIAQAAAQAALGDAEHVARARALNGVELPRVSERLTALGVRVYPSQTNFVLADFAPRQGGDVYQALLRRGVIVRPMAPYGLPTYLRISIGLAAENDRLLAALAEVL
jgi:histidinol-phosphate aminotransferase